MAEIGGLHAYFDTGQDELPIFHTPYVTRFGLSVARPILVDSSNTAPPRAASNCLSQYSRSICSVRGGNSDSTKYGSRSLVSFVRYSESTLYHRPSLKWKASEEPSREVSKTRHR